MKLKTVKGAGAKAKGSRAERQWRDELRRIYSDTKKHEKIKRVPMSGASWMKGDVVDLNDYDSLYEVKNQEKLEIPSWWRQAVREAGSNRTPFLVITQNHRPFYVFMAPDVAEVLISEAGFAGVSHDVSWRKQVGLLDAIDRGETYWTVTAEVGTKDSIVLTGMKGEDYITYKKALTDE